MIERNLLEHVTLVTILYRDHFNFKSIFVGIILRIDFICIPMKNELKFLRGGGG